VISKKFCNFSYKCALGFLPGFSLGFRLGFRLREIKGLRPRRFFAKAKNPREIRAKTEGEIQELSWSYYVIE
jgi:hypothetical protein